ncbi:MAG: right-handed parallel beta-helix repeat-containing protein [Kiritimatiellia bacterium]
MNDLGSMAAPFMGGWVDARAHGASGSEFQAAGQIRAGSNEIELEDVGDFRAGQEVTISRCHLHHYGTVYGLRVYGDSTPITDEVELRGLDAEKAWQTFVIHFDRTSPVTFRWMAVDPACQTLTTTHPVIHRHWRWQGEELPVNAEWLTLADGVQMRFKKLDWLAGHCIAFHARNRLLARITAIRGRTLVLSECANRASSGAIVRHHDQLALQSALDCAIAERKGLFIPAGRYRLNRGLCVRNASVRIEGAHREHVTLDVSEDHASAFWLLGGRDIVIRNIGMVGHTGFMELPAASFKTAGGVAFWPATDMKIKGCAAVKFAGTEHVLFEDLKASRMAAEAFYSQGPDRYRENRHSMALPGENPEPLKQYTKSCIYHRCRVSDCAFNAFNNNDHAENTSILHCHVERATNFCENASRFTRIIGNYVLDGCATSVHSGRTGDDDPHKIGPTQAIIADNVFEGGIYNGGVAVGNSASQVVIANNLFVGYSKESAVFVLGGRRVIVTGNHIDLTRIESNPDNERCGICVEASNVTVADNHVYVRGERSDKVTGIHVADHAVNIHVHDNLVENCHCGFRTGARVYVPPAGKEEVETKKDQFEFHHTESEVVETLGPRSFHENSLPFRCDDGAPYRGWNLRWLSGSRAGATMTIENYSAKERKITLKESFAPRAGDKFAVYPGRANWQIHHNTFSDCAVPMAVDLFSLEGVRIESNAM